MKFSGSGNSHQEVALPQAPVRKRRRGLLQASDPNGSWSSVAAGILKMSICLGIAALAYVYLPSFEGWSFGDSFPGGKLGFATCMAIPLALVGAATNLWSALRSFSRIERP